mmetsp:Transcript_16651/g.31541  ORF Transcript_16651/g.31541 Transcript_16651/m.31541 type:complete len:262 (+) Transcript_16651:179-964(+)
MSGRGRGKKYTPPTGGRAFLMRSAEECGLDSRNLRSLQDITRPALFPDIQLHSSGDNRLLRVLEQQKVEEASKAESVGGGGMAVVKKDEDEGPPKLAGVKRSAQTLFLISKGREIHHRIQSSVFYVRPTKDVPDVIRYSDSTKPPPQIDASAVLSNCLGGRKKTKLGRYVPEELVSGQIQVLNSDAGIGMGGYNLVELEAKERRRRRLGSVDTAPGEGDEDGDEEGVVVEDEEEDDGEDYVKDYYESEGDESAGDDAEATF